MAVNFDIVYYQNLHYNDTNEPIDSYKLTPFQSDLLDKQDMYNVAINKFKISDMSTIPLGFNLPFNEWEVALKYNNKNTKQTVAQIGTDSNSQNVLYSVNNNNTIALNTYDKNGTLTNIQNLTLLTIVENLNYVVADSKENIYVIGNTTLYVFDPTGELLDSVTYSNLVYLSMTKTDKVIVTDKGSEKVYILSFDTVVNELILVNTISQNNAGNPFVNISSCVHDGTSGVVTYNSNCFSVIDSGFNVISDSLNNPNVENLVASEVMSDLNLGYLVDNTTNAPINGFFVANMNLINNNIEQRTINITSETFTLTNSFEPKDGIGNLVFPTRAFYDSINSLYWATDNSTIYIYDASGNFLDDKVLNDITYSFFEPNGAILLTACNLASQSNILGFKYTSNQIVEVIGTIRINKAGNALSRISSVSSDGITIIASYFTNGQMVTTTYSAETYEPLADQPYDNTNFKNISDATVDTVNDKYFVNENARSLSLYVSNYNYVDSPNINLCPLNADGSLGSAIISDTERVASISATNGYTFTCPIESVDPLVPQYANQIIKNVTPQTQFNSYLTPDVGQMPLNITTMKFVNGGQTSYLNIGLCTFDGQYHIVAQGSDNTYHIAYTISTSYDSNLVSPYIAVNPIDNTIWIFSDGDWNPNKCIKSNIAPALTTSSPWLDFTGVTFAPFYINCFSGVYPNSVQCLTFDVYTNQNDVYATLNNDGHLYKGYYNSLSATIYFNLYIPNLGCYGYLTIPYPEATLPSGQQSNKIQQYQLSNPNINPKNTYDMPNSKISNMIEYYKGKQILISLSNPEMLFAIDLNLDLSSVKTIIIPYLGMISIVKATPCSNVHSFTLSTSQISETYTINDARIISIARNMVNKYILVQTFETSQLIFLNAVLLTNEFSVSFTNSTGMFSTSTVLGDGNPNLLIYSYDAYLQQINSAFNTCLQRLKLNDPSINITSAPSFSYSRQTGLVTLTYDPTFSQTTAGIYLGKNLSQYLKFITTPPQTLELTEMNKISLPNGVGTLTQNTLSLYLLNNLDKIIITTNLMIATDFTTDSLKSTNVFTEFDIDTSNPTTMFNDGCLLYSAVLLRNYVMLSPSSLRSVQYELWYQFKNGEKYKFMISPNNNVSIKLQFTRAY